MARWNLRRTRGQRPPPGFLLAPTAIGGEADLERQHHVDEGLEGYAHEQQSDQIDDVPLLERSCERRDPLLLGAPRLEIAPPQPFELDEPDDLQRQPHRQPRIALFAQHLEIARMISPRLFLIDRGFGLLRIVGVVGGRRLHDAERSEEHTSELQSLMRISYAV